MDPKLLQMLTALGATPEELAALASGGGGGPAGPDPNDPPVYFGSKPHILPRSSKFTPTATPSRRDTLENKRSARFKPDEPRRGRIDEDVKSLSQANLAFYEMEESDLVKLQKRLFAAGILDPKRTALGDYDDLTYSAFSAINERAARFKMAGRNLTPSDVLSMVEKASLAAGFGADAAEQGRVTESSNPMNLEAVMQVTAKQALGRKLKAAEVQKFVTLYKSMESSRSARQSSAYDAVEAGADATIEDQVDPSVAANQFIDANYANEAGGQDAYGYLGALKNLLGG